MSKPKTNDRMQSEKDLAKLMAEIQRQGLQTTEEINNFLQNLEGQNLRNLPERTDNKGRSQDLVYDAHGQPAAKGKKLIKKALELDPNNADAYNYLAGIERDIDKAIILYGKAIKAGEKTLGKKFFKEQKGHFWGMIETRPYMRAKVGLADCLYSKGQVGKAIDIYKEMLELNPGDNQGVRHLLSTLLLSKKDLTEFQSFIESNDAEDCAVWNYNNALYHFKKSGSTKESEKALLKAYKGNKHVIDYMLGIKDMPNELPQYIGRGDENEAIFYVNTSWAIWDGTDGALDRLYEFSQKRLRLN